MDLEQLTRLFKWMTIINMVALVLSSVLIMLLRNVMCRWHAKLFGIPEQSVAMAAYGYMGIYKMFVLVFNIVPYIALSIIA
jgi:hypothetical protein